MTFTVTFKALVLNVATVQGKGHKIRLQDQLKSKVTWWDSIGENAYWYGKMLEKHGKTYHGKLKPG